MTYRYKVLASSEETGIVAVVDGEGRCHVGRALGPVPLPNAELNGEPPAIGVRELRVAHKLEQCPVALVLLDCEPEVAARVVAPINLL